MDFNILSLNGEPGNSAHIIYNKEHGKQKKKRDARGGTDGAGRRGEVERGGGMRNEGLPHTATMVTTYGDRGDLGQDPTVAKPTKTERNARGERAKSSCYK